MKKEDESRLDRRKFLHYSAIGAVTLMAWPFISACNNKSANSNDQKSDAESGAFEPDLDFELTAVQRDISIFSGSLTSVWMFESKLIKGNPGALTHIDGSYLGPTINVGVGQKVRIRFVNNLNEESIVHWHGMHVPEQYDGHPKDVIAPGETLIYEYEIMNRAGTYWYHPHPHKLTGHQVYNGLAGMFIVTDEEEQALNLPSGKYDFPIVIQDRTFDDDNQLVYINNGHMRRNDGFLGEQIFINGTPSQTISAEQGAYRLRLLNGSNSRYYKLGWEDGTPLTVIGTDGSLLAKPRNVPYVMMSSGERIDLWLDLGKHALGTEMVLKSLPFYNGQNDGEGMMGGMGHGRRGNSQTQIPLGSEYPIVKIIINKPGGNKYKLPENLVTLNKLVANDAVNIDNPRAFTFAGSMMRWTINGRTFKTEEVTDYETVKLNSTEVWEFINGGGGHGMMGNNNVAHPIHIHQVQFNILERNSDNMDAELWDSIKDGFVDEGWKDSLLLMPGMKIKVLMAFKNYKGLFLYHCHNLEHEDMGMMRNYKIE